MQMGLMTVNKDCDFVSNLLIDNFADMFDGGLGELPGTHHLQCKPDAIPVTEELHKLFDQGSKLN